MVFNLSLLAPGACRAITISSRTREPGAIPNHSWGFGLSVAWFVALDS